MHGAGRRDHGPEFLYPLGYIALMSEVMAALRMWDGRRWLISLAAGVITALLVALPTAVIPNPVFGRAIDTTWWSYPVVIVTGILGGLLVGTYVKVPGEAPPDQDESLDRASKLGGVGALLSFFAVGCPVCNKLVLIALGATGAVTWFAPIQPILAIASIALMSIALVIRLRGQVTCDVTV